MGDAVPLIKRIILLLPHLSNMKQKMVRGTAAAVLLILLAVGTSTAAVPVVAQGDEFTIQGIATGGPSNVYVWIFGDNYKTLFQATSVGSDATYSYTLERSETKNLAPGMYYAVVQHPMYGRPGVTGTPTTPGLGQWITCDYSGQQTQQTTDVSQLTASDAANVLVTYLQNPNVADTYTQLSFFVEAPYMTVGSATEGYIGGIMEIGGKTNLAPGDRLLVTVTPFAFSPTQKTAGSGAPGSSGTVTVQQGSGYNYWTYSFDTTGFEPGDYQVIVESVDTGQQDSSIITLTYPSAIIATATPLPTQLVTAATTTTTVVPVYNETPLPATAVISALAVSSLLLMKRKRND